MLASTSLYSSALDASLELRATVLKVTMSNPSDSSSTSAAYTELLSLAAHEFRTPASVVGGYLRMILKDTASPLGDRQRKMLEEAEKSCARMVALIAELSDIAKLDTGTAPVTPSSFDLFSAIRDVAATVHEAEDRGVSLDIRGEPTGAPMTGDLPRIRVAFDAFFRAVLREQAGPSRVVVDCTVVKKDSGASAIVVIAPDGDLARASTAAHGPFNEYRGGLGLALPIGRRVVERHGGQVWSAADAESSAPSRGGAILVSLPLAESSR